MALKHLVDLDLGGNEIQNVVLQNLGTAPSGTEGQIFYDTGANCVKVHTGSGFVRVGLTADGSTITESNGTISVGSIAISKVTNLQSSLDGKVDDSQVLTNVPAGAVFTDTTYTVGDGGLTQKNFTTTLKTKLDGIAAGATNTEEPAIVNAGGTPELATGVTAGEVRSLIGAGTSNFNGTWGSLTGKPSTFAPSAHTHAIAEIDDLEAQLGAKAPLASPTFTGTPAAPTANGGTNTTQIATTAFVVGEIARVIDSAPGALDTLNEIAAALGDDPNFATTITNQINGKLSSTHDMTLTLAGDATGAATFTNMGNATLTVTVADDSHNHTIANVDGLQTALNSKLNSSSYTAADVLTKIKTVDGAGSGLDADKLDGQSSAYYRNYNNLTNKPSIPAVAIINVSGEPTPVTVPLAPVASKAVVQVYETATMSLVMTEITQVNDGEAVITLADGVDYTVVATGRQ